VPPHFRDNSPVSYLATSIHPDDASPPAPAPQATQPDERWDPPNAASHHPGAAPCSSAVRSRRRSRGPPSDDDGLDALDIATICRRTGFGRSFVYEAIRRGELRAGKFGRLTRILRRDYEAWLAAAPPVAPTMETPRPTLAAGRHVHRRAPR
jgi:excisionase family DNA binding protein